MKLSNSWSWNEVANGDELSTIIFEMAMSNKVLSPDLEIVCFMVSHEYQFHSSSLMKEAATFGGNIASFVPKHVAETPKKKTAGGI